MPRYVSYKALSLSLIMCLNNATFPNKTVIFNEVVSLHNTMSLANAMYPRLSKESCDLAVLRELHLGHPPPARWLERLPRASCGLAILREMTPRKMAPNTSQGIMRSCDLARDAPPQDASKDFPGHLAVLRSCER